MPEQVNNTSNEIGGLVTYSLLVDGTAVSGSIEIVSIETYQEINRITRASLEIVDGEPDAANFRISSSNVFLPGKTIEISLGYDSNNVKVFKGIIISNAQKASDNGSLLVVECRDEAVKMTLDKKSKHYNNLTASDIAETLLNQYNITNHDITAATVTHKQLVQYNSSDWDFMISRLDAVGLLCILNNGETRIKKMAATPTGSNLPVFEFGNNIIEFDGTMDARAQSGSVILQSWNYTTQELETEDVALNQSSPGGISTDDLGTGQTTTIRASGKKEPTEQQALAKTKKVREVLSKIKGRVKFFGRVAQPVIAGDFITLQGLGANFNGDVFVSAIQHDYSNGDWTTTATLGWDENFFTEQINPLSDTSGSGDLNSLGGLQTGIITDIIDADGDFRIKLRLPMVNSQEDGVYARLATLDAGNKRGTFFMPEIGDEVVVGFMNNNPAQPVILGMLHSSKNAAPLQPESANNKKGYVSRSEIKILIDDGEKSITIQTPGGHIFVMNDNEKSIKLTDSNSNKITMEQSGITIESATALTLKAATTLSISAPQLSAKADGELKMEGGGSTKVSSSGVMTIQGSIVNIN
ncbi:MAG: type VI secretion system tip protein VgrG [Bacteroidales bacterium]